MRAGQVNYCRRRLLILWYYYLYLNLLFVWFGLLQLSHDVGSLFTSVPLDDALCFPISRSLEDILRLGILVDAYFDLIHVRWIEFCYPPWPVLFPHGFDVMGSLLYVFPLVMGSFLSWVPCQPLSVTLELFPAIDGRPLWGHNLDYPFTLSPHDPDRLQPSATHIRTVQTPSRRSGCLAPKYPSRMCWSKSKTFVCSSSETNLCTRICLFVLSFVTFSRWREAFSSSPPPCLSILEPLILTSLHHVNLGIASGVLVPSVSGQIYVR